MRCLVPPGDVNQLTINAGSLVDSRYTSKKTAFTVLTVPRALSRIHRITKFTLKRASISQQLNRCRQQVLHTAMSLFKTGGALPPFKFNRQDRLFMDTGSAPSCCARLYFTTSGLRWSRLYSYSENIELIQIMD